MIVKTIFDEVYQRICRKNHAYYSDILFKFAFKGIRLFNGNSADENRTAYGFGYKTDKIDIYSNSWGPSDNGYTVKSLSLPEKRALSYGASRVGASYASLLSIIFKDVLLKYILPEGPSQGL